MPKTLFIGHSLVNNTMPWMLNRLFSGTGHSSDYQIINGASLEYNWQHSWDIPDDPGFINDVKARDVLPRGGYDTVVLTEQIAMSGTMASNFNTLGTRQDAMQFARLAWLADSSTRVLIYETWGYMNNEATWRANIARDHAAWQGVADYLSANNPSGAPNSGVVPAGQALGRLYDAIEAGRGAGFDTIRDVFSTGDPWNQTIHLNDIGNYFVALVQYAAIYGHSPVGLQTTVQKPWSGGAYGGWTPVQATLMQHIAWESVVAEGLPLVAGSVRPVVRIGSNSNDTLTAGNGDDRAYGGNGHDLIHGAGGRDLVFGGTGADRLHGDGGNDWLLGDNGNDSVYGGDGNDRMFGGNEHDGMWGGSGNDTMQGDNGNDSLNGEGGVDLLNGGKGSDRLAGGVGSDTLTGGDGADRFVFANGGDADRIMDFDRFEGDRLVFSDDLWSGTRTAQQLVNAARLTSAGVVFDFGDGDTLTLVGVHSKTGLAELIDII